MKPTETRLPPSARHHPARWWPVPAGVFLFAAGLLLGTLAKGLGRTTPELGIDVALAQERNPLASTLALFIHAALGPVGGVLILAVACVVLAFVLRRPLQALAFGATASVGWLSAEVGKLAVARLRPPADATHAMILETSPDSFPSGHTALAVGLAWAIVLVLATAGSARRLAAVLGIAGVGLVAFTRLYLGVHYPSDVIGAMLIATAGVLIWWPVWVRLIEPRLRGTALIGRLSAVPARKA